MCALMGMFNWVEYQCPCPKCGEMIEGFQTKDDDSDERGLVLALVQPEDVDNYYSACDNPDCDTWIEFNRVEVPVLFRMTITSA